MLELKHVSAGYGETEILHDLSFRFEDGVNYCLLGPNRSRRSIFPIRSTIR